ncbi:MAG: HDIG domain-containing protein [Candidatus Aminicenantes bacterium]|nr:HDIG domain-containing protein [Candidatus Aminicenantes bacterium]NIM84105.1 HDIG domain-containing protein [Candidatus Aminicenantes bacterium]NIN17242.1 HDIG domain-containing protein [Candidatus Aminicenantes bacterium]NIN47260.1 HDIG domain-containing protein [Candidatus Aminicenantes bacterium]NIN90187.1 HDIG domain-containing protein [Candidatus Aminicenantes bacterium]
MNRDEALALIKEHLKAENLVKHCLAVEACMKAFAEKFGEDVDKWGLAGLLHDLDYQYTVNDPDNHTLKTAEMLTEYNIDEDIIHAIKAHNFKAPLDSKMDMALYTVDPTTGFIIACALMHPSKKLENVHLKRMKKRFKEKAFAKGASREQMKECVKMGVELDDFLVTCLTALQKIASELGL